jgi:ketosteroid isomerase-like protein
MPDDNVATIRRLYDALMARDAIVIQEIFAPDATISQSPELPWGATTQATTACSRSF